MGISVGGSALWTEDAAAGASAPLLPLHFTAIGPDEFELKVGGSADAGLTATSGDEYALTPAGPEDATMLLVGTEAIIF